MKKIFFAILSVALLCSACEKGSLPQLEQNPYRKVVEYTPSTVTLDVPGALTPDMLYDWISMSQSGNTATFTLRRNTQDVIRRAEFTIAGSSQKAVISQKPHKLDATVTGNLDNLDLDAGIVDISFDIATALIEDYESWGYVLSMTNDIAKGTDKNMGKASTGKKNIQITDVKEGNIYYVWGYIASTEGDKIYSNLVAVFTVPVLVKAGEDLQKAINSANQFQEIRVQGGASFNGPIKMGGQNVNKTVTGGWDESFTKQDMNNLSVLNGNTANYGFWCAEEDGTPMNGYCNISFFEVKNCKGDHGTAFHCVGGPITITNCYVHDNWSEKGAIGTNEGKHATTLTVANCKVVNNGGDGGHGPAFGFGEGKSDTEPVTAILVNNLIEGNIASKKDGYASTFICYNQTNLVLVNNTIVNNYNWAEYGGPYSGLVLRGDVASAFVNNIIVGNFTSPCTQEMTEPAYERQDNFINMGGGAGTLAYNIIEGNIKESGNITLDSNINVALGVDVATIVNSDYQPQGKALGAGTLGSIKYNSNKAEMGGPFTVNVGELLNKYNTDLAGNPRVVGGKVDLGCYQAQ